MMDGQRHRRPAIGRFTSDLLERFHRERLERLVFQMTDVSAGVVIADVADERDDRAAVRAGNGFGDLRRVQWRAADAKSRGHE
jgi:hypothetical protein